MYCSKPLMCFFVLPWCRLPRKTWWSLHLFVKLLIKIRKKQQKPGPQSNIIIFLTWRTCKRKEGRKISATSQRVVFKPRSTWRRHVALQVILRDIPSVEYVAVLSWQLVSTYLLYKVRGIYCQDLNIQKLFMWGLLHFISFGSFLH